MNLKELDSFRLSDAVAFHDNLNPKLFKGNKLLPLVKDQLITIAKDFLEELGIHDLDVRDITISGSNAAYSYTPHSDLDLHILVNMDDLPQSDVYKELFNAKKNVYNDTHDIKIHNIPVELYVQDAGQTHHSLGEYSVKDDKWIKIPSKRRANFDQAATKAKYDKLLELVKVALKTKESSKLDKILKKIKQYRQAGLDKYGEFGPENLAYKALRSKGYITKLYDLRDKLHSEKLSIEGMYSQPKKTDKLTDDLRKEFEDYHPNGPPPGPEFKPTMPAGTVRVDVSDVYDWYKLGQHISNLKGLGHHDFGKGPPSTIMAFGSEPEEHKYIKDLEKTGLTTTDIDPIDKNQPKGMKRQKVDPTYNVNEEPEDWRPYQGLRDPKNEPGVNLFPGKDIVGQRVYHCTNSLKSIQKSGGLKPRPDETGAREYGRLTTNEHPFIPVIGVWFSVGKPDWVGKYCLSFVIEPTDKVYVAYAKSKGDLTPNVVLNGISIDRLKIEKIEDVAEEVHKDVTGDKYFLDPTDNVRIGDFEFNARTFSGALGDPNARGLQIRAYDPKRPNGGLSIGSADFIVKSDKKGNQWLESDDTEVDEKYRGKGVAAMMYAFAKSLGNDIKDSPYKSKAGGEMWRKWGSDAEHLAKEGVAEGSENLNYIGNCTDDDVIEHIFGDATNFAQAVEEHGDEFTIDDLVVKYDPESDVHSFYYKQQGVAEGYSNTTFNVGHLQEAVQTLGPQLYVPRQATNEDLKPKAQIWTSSAIQTQNGYTSAWVEWSKTAMPEWVSKEGILYDVSPGARILNINSDKDAMRIARKYGVKVRNEIDLFMHMPWDLISKDYDAIHHVPKNRGLYMSAWDVESTAWLNKKFLINPRKVIVDNEQPSEQGVAESASGYIPSNAEKNDPRFKTALTVDIKPDTLKKNAQKLGSKISRAGIPPTLKASGKF